MARDFSDGLLLSEILNNFFPKLLDQHIFFDRNSFESKKKQWELLYQKGLKKLDVSLSK